MVLAKDIRNMIVHLQAALIGGADSRQVADYADRLYSVLYRSGRRLPTRDVFISLVLTGQFAVNATKQEG